MRLTHLISVKPSNITGLLLLGTAANVLAIYLIQILRAGDDNRLGMITPFLFAVGFLLWKKRCNLSLESSFPSTVVGTVLISALFLINLLAFPNTPPEKLLLISPFVAALGLGLIASGFKGLRQYKKELFLLFFLGTPEVLLSSLIDLSKFTAQFSAFILWYLGFDVSLQGVYINLPSGSVQVYGPCSGMSIVTYMLGVAVLGLVMFPPKRNYRILVPFIAVIIGFVVNCLRVALMAILLAANSQEAFDYWHGGDGSLVFAMAAVLIFGGIYWQLYPGSTLSNQAVAQSRNL